MSDQGALFEPVADKPLKWWQKPLACQDCKRVTTRPQWSLRPCAWCRGALAELIRA
jgi:hypothetical protein